MNLLKLIAEWWRAYERKYYHGEPDFYCHYCNDGVFGDGYTYMRMGFCSERCANQYRWNR